MRRLECFRAAPARIGKATWRCNLPTNGDPKFTPSPPATAKWRKPGSSALITSTTRSTTAYKETRRQSQPHHFHYQRSADYRDVSDVQSGKTDNLPILPKVEYVSQT